MPRVQQGDQRYERKAREAFGYDITEEIFDERSARGTSETDIPRNQRLGREDLWRGDGTAGEKVDLGVLVERREKNAEVVERRVKVSVGSGFTRQATAVSQSAGTDDNLPYVE